MSTKISKATRDKICDAMAKYLEDRDWNVYRGTQANVVCDDCFHTLRLDHNFCGKCGKPVDKSIFSPSIENTKQVLYKAFLSGKKHYNSSKKEREIRVPDAIISYLKDVGWSIDDEITPQCKSCNNIGAHSDEFCTKCGAEITHKISESLLSAARSEIFGAFNCGLRILEKTK